MNGANDPKPAVYSEEQVVAVEQADAILREAGLTPHSKVLNELASIKNPFLLEDDGGVLDDQIFDIDDGESAELDDEDDEDDEDSEDYNHLR